MSYPPDVHLLRDLAFSGTRSAGVASNHMAITPGLCDGDGVRLGVLATLVDVTGAGIALQAVSPDWIATADLQVHSLRPVTDGFVVIECRPLRVGARRIVVEAELRDDAGAPCALGRMAFARIPGSATKATVDRSPDAEPTTRFTMDGGRPIDEPITQRCGMEIVGPGQYRFEKTPYVENSFGSVNGGVLALSAEAAAVSAAGGGPAQDVHIHYLEQIGDGPVAVTAEVVRDDGTGILCTVRIEDRADRRLVAVADVLVSQPS